MVVPPHFLNCVVFVGYRNTITNDFRFLGSACIFGEPKSADYCERVYFVTARHVISGLRNTGVTDVWLSVNLKKGNSGYFKTSIDSWFVHPTDATIDIAIVELGTGSEIDHGAFPSSLSATTEVFQKYSVCHGDEVFIVGLFKHCVGQGRHIPIVRTGNLASVPAVRIPVDGFGQMESYLIEARSIGGLSGSPVFLNLAGVRYIATHGLTTGSPFFFLGIIHGHYDEKTAPQGKQEQENSPPDRVNTGIAIVTPFQKVEAVIEAFKASEAQSLGLLMTESPNFVAR